MSEADRKVLKSWLGMPTLSQELGLRAHAVLASVFRTYRRQGRDILEAVVELLRHGPGHVLEFDHTSPTVPSS